MSATAEAPPGTVVVRVLAYLSTAEFSEDLGDRPLPECWVVVEKGRDGSVARVKTNQDGEAVAPDVPAGSYRINVDVPPGYQAPERKWIDDSSRDSALETSFQVAGGQVITVTVRLRPRPGAVRVKLKVADPREDLETDTSLELKVGAWQRGREVASCEFTLASAHDVTGSLSIDAPGKVELRPMSEVTWLGHRFLPDPPGLQLEIAPGGKEEVEFTYQPAPAQVQARATLVERSAGDERSQPLPGVSFMLIREGGEQPWSFVSSGDPASTFTKLEAGRYSLTAAAPTGSQLRLRNPSTLPLELQVAPGQTWSQEFVFEPIQPGGEPEASAGTPPEGAVQPGGTGSPTSTPPPAVRRPTMTDNCEAPGDRMRTDEELGSISVKIHFPYGVKTITATKDSTATNPEHLKGEAAVAHLLRVDMRGELETGIQDEARKALGVEDVNVELLAVNERQSVELVLAVIGLAATLIKDAPEIKNGFDRLFQGSLNVVRRVLQRMPRSGPVPAHVVTGSWTQGAALLRMQRELATQPATPEAGRGPAGEASEQPDTDRIAPARLPMPSLLLSIYLLIVNVALIATLIVLVFWQR